MIVRLLLLSVRLRLNSVCMPNDSVSLRQEDECSSVICNIHGQLAEYVVVTPAAVFQTGSCGCIRRRDGVVC